MRLFRAFYDRSRILESQRLETDAGLDRSSLLGEELATSDVATGVGRLAPWLRVPLDGAIRGLRAYQTLNYHLPDGLRWLTWPLVALVSLASVIAYAKGGGPQYLVGAALAPWLAAVCASAGAIYDSIRAFVGSSTRARLAAAAAAGLFALGPSFTVAASSADRPWYSYPLAFGALAGGAMGLGIEAIKLDLPRRKRRPHRRAT